MWFLYWFGIEGVIVEVIEIVFEGEVILGLDVF